MYIRLTSRCNMSCDHCGFSCSARGRDMTSDVFDAALSLSSHYGDSVTLGGGEPTIHPKFWEFFGKSLAVDCQETPPFIVTNGKNKDIAIALARMAKGGVIGAALSQDRYHDSIEPEVVEAFTKSSGDWGHGNSDDLREIWHINSLLNVGRAKLNQLATVEGCICDSIVVEPSGKLWQCGCRKKSFGTVFDPQIPQEHWDSDIRCSQDSA